MNENSEFPVPMMLELCSGGTAYEGKPQIKTEVKLELAAETLRTTPGYSIRVHTPYMLIVKSSSGAEISLTIHGEVLIKNVKSEAEAREAASQVLQLTREAILTPENPQNSHP